MKPSHIFLAILVAAIWGCNFIFIKLGVNEVPPLFLCALRFLLASVPAVFFVRKPEHSFTWVVIYGLIMFGLQFALMFSSFSAGMTAGMASVIGQTQIFFSVLFAVLFLGEVPSFWQIIGGIVAFLGIFVITQHVDNQVTINGVLLVIGAATIWGLGNLITKKLRGVNMISLVVWGSLISCPPLFILSFLLEGPARINASFTHMSWLAIISLLYIVYLSTWFGYGVWNSLIARYPVTLVAPFIFLIPIFGMLSSVLALGESLESWKITASALVLSGLAINLLMPRLTRLRQKSMKTMIEPVE